MSPRTDNESIAAALEEIADLLQAQDSDEFRVRAYRAAAATVLRETRDLSELARVGGARALEALPGVGKSIAATIVDLTSSGRSRLLDRLRGEVSPEDLFTTLPGIGEELAHRLHAELGLETLEDLEVAAHDGRLEKLHGFGARRTRAIRDLLATRLGRATGRRLPSVHGPDRSGSPPVDLLLDVDSEYRRKAAAGELRQIAPRRFNPDHEAWLPVMHATRDGWHFTALYSNTARAHELGTTRDWVVLYFEQDGLEGQRTVVTEHRGPLAGRRVVRGLEDECRAYYRAPGSS